MAEQGAPAATADPVGAALAALRAGRVGEAAESFRDILTRAPANRDAMHGLGAALAASNRFAEALEWFDRAIGDGAVPASWHGNRGTVLRRLGRHGEAAAAFATAVQRSGGRSAAFHASLGDALVAAGDRPGARDAYVRALALAPDLVVCWNNLGNVLQEMDEIEAAIVAYRRALALRQDMAETLINLGNALNLADQPAEALDSFERALALHPGQVSGRIGRGVALHHLGRREAALADFDAAVAARPDHALAHNNRGITLQALGRVDEAVEAFRRSIALAPTDAIARNNLGRGLQLKDRQAEAIESFREAVRLRPTYAEAWSNLGAILETARETEAAIDAYRRAIAAKPGFQRAYGNLGNFLQSLGRFEEAERVLADGLAVDPAHVPSRVNATIARLRIIHRDAAERDLARAAYARDLEALARLPLPSTPAALEAASEAISGTQPFYLAYQGRNDRDLQALWGGFVCRVMAAAHPDLARRPPPRARAPGERIRVGILSGYFRHHSNWKVPIHSWLADLDRSRFAVHGYYVQTIDDDQTRLARSLTDRFVEGLGTVERFARAIRDDALDVLLIPEVGMDPLTVRLAGLRLAPVQATSWGHPQTSGMPSIDAFLSSDLMEPADGQDYYTERLVRLPGLSFRHMPVRVVPATVSRAEIGVEDDAVLFWCCQSLFKYAPEHDRVFPRIAAALPSARFLFLGYPVGERVEAIFRERMQRAFAAAGLDAGRHCRFLGMLVPERFAGVTRIADVFLDSIGWSGCNSTLEALAEDLPVVTCPGGPMRARHSAAILRCMGIEETIAASEDAFVALAVALGGDPARRADLRAGIARAKHAPREDRSYLRGLEDYLRAAAG